MDKTDYCNHIMVRLEELLFHELSVCAAWKVELESRLFLSVPVTDVFSSARNDDFVTLRLSRFF